MSNYALIKPINSVQTIDNIIVASPEVAATYLIANSGDYDYVIDLTNISPAPGMHWMYDPGLDIFTAPAIDYQAELEEALMDVDTALGGAIAAYMAATSIERGIAVGNVMGEMAEAPEDEIDMMVSVVTYLDTKI